jgi:hypothetical protein
MEKGFIPLRMVCKAPRANLVLIPGTRKKVRMILEKVMRRIGCKKILNDMKKEINKLMGINMTMQNMVMV